MRKDYSAPVVTSRPARSTTYGRGQQVEQEKQVDYTGLDILEQVERVLDEKLYTHHYVRASSKWQCKCPFPNCTSTTDSFLLWVGRDVLEEGQMHYHCTHCQRKGDLINFYRQYREATTGIKPDWKEAARFFGINTRTWKVDGQGEQETEGATKRRQQAERQHKAEQAEIDLLGAWYIRARAWLAAGQVTMKDGRQIPLDQARAYLQERGFSLDQAALLGLAYIPTAKELPEIAGEHKLAPWRGRMLFPLAGPKGATGYAGRTLHLWKPGVDAEGHKKALDTWNEARRKENKKTVERHWKTHIPAYYGYEQACQCSTLVIVEGEFDAASICLALVDLPDIAVCAFGKSFQARQIPLSVLTVMLAFDVDQAGQEAIERQKDELEQRGVTVQIVRSPAGKDWNDCLIQAGAGAIRAAIVAQTVQSGSHTIARPGEIELSEDRGDVCIACGCVPDLEDENAYYICEDRSSAYWGDLYCMSCWQHVSKAAAIAEQGEEQGGKENVKSDRTDAVLAQVRQIFEAEEDYVLALLPVGMSTANYIERYSRGERPGRVIHPAKMEEMGDQSRDLVGTGGDQVDHRCKKHGKPLQYSDEMGGRYCDHVDCWERYRLIRAGARRSYPALAAVIDPRDYLADISASPVRYTASGLPVYPARPAICKQVIAAGADAWREYVAGRGYQDIDQAIKALASA